MSSIYCSTVIMSLKYLVLYLAYIWFVIYIYLYLSSNTNIMSSESNIISPKLEDVRNLTLHKYRFLLL